ncbi:MAG: SEC-C metal-binding domain-containing protein, partial [Woeseiaceae bacterium]
EEELRAMQEQRRKQEAMQYKHAQASALTQDQRTAAGGSQRQAVPPSSGENVATFVRSSRKVGRNEPCPCGSGKKYKQCHGKLT